MESELTQSKNCQVFIAGQGKYFYKVKPVEITNALGISIAILKEYSVTNLDNENYKLYKTNDGNWYDVPEANPGAGSVLLMALKLAISNQENEDCAI